ncbi:hypothetical protein QYF36_011181 [Acer negundo]|nr:hypothetical protein QYF36_011181 [Acer negundo]
MGKLKHHFDPSKNHQTRMDKVKKNPIKVTYISSPMMVKASNASEFRAIVQQLTGKNSLVPHADEHDLVYTATSLLTHGEESNHHHHHQALDHQGRETITDHHDEYLMDNAFSNNIIMSLLDHDLDDQFDGRFLWREIVSA